MGEMRHSGERFNPKLPDFAGNRAKSRIHFWQNKDLPWINQIRIPNLLLIGAMDFGVPDPGTIGLAAYPPKAIAPKNRRRLNRINHDRCSRRRCCRGWSRRRCRCRSGLRCGFRDCWFGRKIERHLGAGEHFAGGRIHIIRSHAVLARHNALGDFERPRCIGADIGWRKIGIIQIKPNTRPRRGFARGIQRAGIFRLNHCDRDNGPAPG